MMKPVIYVTAALCALTMAGFHGAAAQISKSEIDKLDQLSQEKSEGGAYRNHGPPVAQTGIPSEQLRQPSGMWTCLGTADYQPIYSAPSTSSRQVGVALGQVAAGRDQGDFTSVLFKEGVVGFIPKSKVHNYRNSFHPRLTCTFAGVRGNGTVVFRVK